MVNWKMKDLMDRAYIFTGKWHKIKNHIFIKVVFKMANLAALESSVKF